MSDARSEFVYATYIRSTPDKVWHALTTPEFMTRYFFGAKMESDWKEGASWKMVHHDGRVSDSGQIVEMVEPKLIVLKWRHENTPEIAAEGYSTCVMEIEPQDNDVVKLTIHHSIDRARSKLVEAVSGGWPRILSNLKSLLETGDVLMVSKGCAGGTNKAA